jgi:SpoVK/Ycf46/Vps4 family AAA+-type ATPase
MGGFILDRTERGTPWLDKIAEAALSGDAERLQLVLLSAMRSLRKSDPLLSKRLGELLAQHTANPGALRWKNASPPPPTDTEEGMALVRFADVTDTPSPVLSQPLRSAIEQFLAERQNRSQLLKEGFMPPSSILLIGAPGTGKTMLARWLASQLGLPLVIQDLATSISSLLGKTGFNLRRTLDYARAHPCLLLLDEFDAIAKRRDDTTELGELKRIVNVLLKELEEWPMQSVLVAATNHPDLLDPAINRRFHLVLEIELPDEERRKEIMARVAGRFAQELPDDVLAACARSMVKQSGSDVDRMVQAAVRRHLTRNVPFTEALVQETVTCLGSDMDKLAWPILLRAMQQVSGGRMTVRELAEMFCKSPSTVQYHLTKEVLHGKPTTAADSRTGREVLEVG